VKGRALVFALACLALGGCKNDPRVLVAYSVGGDSLTAKITYMKGGKVIEEERVLPWQYTYEAKLHEPLYLAAEKLDKKGQLSLGIMVNNRIVKEAVADEPGRVVGINAHADGSLRTLHAGF
jgi:hypothetical protein